MKIVETEQELRACYPVMKELRPHLASEDAFVAQIMRQREQDYHMLAVWDGDEVVALAGYRYQENTVYGRFLYVDDLVATQRHRSRRWGVTFNTTPEGKIGTLADRPVHIAVSSGGWRTGDRARQPDFLEPYLRAILPTIGLKDLHFFSLQALAAGPDATTAAYAAVEQDLAQHFVA